MIYTHKNSLEGQQTEQQLLLGIRVGRTISTRDVLLEFIMRHLYNVWAFVDNFLKV